MKKVLLIGTNSYIAKSFEDYLKQTNCSTIRTNTVSASNGEWKNVDMSQYDSIVMLSAIVHRKEDKLLKDLYLEVNCRLPVDIANRAIISGVKQFVFLSSASVYGSKISRITKDTEPQPESMYGRSKYEAEKQILRLKTNFFKIAIIRPPKVYGTGCKGNFAKLEKLANYIPIFPKFKNKQSMIYIENLCEYIKCLIENESDGIFLPQSNSYMNTSIWVKNIRAQKGKKTFLVPGLGWIIRILLKHNNTIKKIFGDLYYE